MTDDPGMAAPGAEPGATSGGGWGGPLLLLGAVLITATFRIDVLIGVPFIALVLFLPVERRWSIVVAAFFAFLVATGPGGDGVWWVERAWAVVAAGWFVALTLRWPDEGFLKRGLGAVAGTVGVFALAFVARPGAWAAIDWRVGERIRLAIGTAIETVGVLQGEPLTGETRDAIAEAVGVQAQLFPAVLALGTLAALGLAWWMYGRWARGWPSPLGGLTEFRFSDHLVWALIGGLALTLFGLGEGWERAGSNTVVFMGALYVLRGVGVILFASGGLSFFGALVGAIAVLFLAPIVIAGTLVIGVGDTWLDLRTKLRSRTSG